jgi:hypothetical protein
MLQNRMPQNQMPQNKNNIAMKVALVVAVAAGAASVSSCGVRGKPQPPLTPPELGRGQPSFKGASDNQGFSNVPSPGASPSPIRNKSLGDEN